jgi:DNA-binding beta-propeller fold protein YncE
MTANWAEAWLEPVCVRKKQSAAGPQYVGDSVRTKANSGLKTLLGTLAVMSLWLSGCGGGGSNVLTVTVTDSLGGVVVVTQADTITATVTGPDLVNGVADVNVVFSCTYTTTTVTGTTTKTSSPLDCGTAEPAIGTFSNVQPTTEIYTAPSVLPDQTKFPNLVLTVKANSTAVPSKSGTVTLTLDSGILVSIAPTTATLAVGNNGNVGESKLFTASLTTDTIPGDVVWGLTNSTVNTGGTPSIAGTYTLTTPQCSPSCGTIAAAAGGNEIYTAPSTLPTNTTATIYAIAKQDNTRVAIATITLVAGGNITFNSLWPNIVPQGASQADVFLNATNLTSQIGLTLTNNTTGVTTGIDAGSNALKVFFTPSTYGATTGPVSTGARLRLTAAQLALPVTYTVGITPGNPLDQTMPIATFNFTVVPVRPGLVASNPSDIAEGTTNSSVSVDGGYYGASPNLAVSLNFNGNALAIPTPPVGSDPRRLIGTVQSTGDVRGLLPINVTNALDVSNSSTVYSNIAILPSYANQSDKSISTTPLPFDSNNIVFPPCPLTSATCVADTNGNYPFQLCTTGCTYPATIPLGASTKPSAIALDPILGYAAVTEAATNMVQFINLSTTPPSLAGAFPTGSPAAGNLPTGVAIDRQVCAKGTAADPATGQCPAAGPFQSIAAVVNYQAQTLTVLTIPGGTLLETIPLNNLIPPSGLTGAGANPSPNPYSVAIDPFTHRALVAFASTNAGFVVNLDPSQNPSICLPGFAPGDGTSYCPVALATLNTGTNPQIAFETGAHMAYVTPGGAGTLTAVNLTNPSQGPLQIASAMRTANIVTVTMAPNTPHNIVPGTNPTVLISGLPLGAGSPSANPPIAPTSFNGAFPVLTVINNLQFTYSQAGPNDTSTSTTAQQGFLSVGTDDITYSISPTIQGIDINPITFSAALADPNNGGFAVGGPQVTFINSLDQNVSALSVCNAQNLAIVTPAQPCAPELGISSVAYQPFTNTVVSLRYDLGNLQNNQISLLDPSAGNRVTIVETGQMTATSICFPTASCAANPQPTGTTTVNLNGALAVDPIHNVALAVNSGSGTITPLYLGNIKPLQIESVNTPPVDAGGGVASPALLSQAVLINSTALPNSISGIQIFGRGFNSSSQVRLNGVPLPASDVVFSSASPNELLVTLPATNGSQNILTGPQNFALDVANAGGTTSNVMDLHVVEAIPIPPCAGVAAAPGGVAIADDLVNSQQNFAVVTEINCAQVAVINLNAGAKFASLSTIATGKGPTGVATIPRYGYAVVSNNTDGTASILDLTLGTRAVGATTDIVVGTTPNGVAIEQETGLAVVANTGSNTATVIDMTPLQASPQGTIAPQTVATDQQPIAVAIDPDGGANATGLAVVTALNISATPASGAVDAVDISLAVPAKNTTATTSVGSIPTGIVFDPASGSQLFYATESDSNAFVTFNPTTSSVSTVQVGINPFSIAYNPQTSSILTVNSASNTISIIDSLSFQNQSTLGIGGISLFSAAIEPLSNLAVIADQANNRVLLFAMPH